MILIFSQEKTHFSLPPSSTNFWGLLSLWPSLVVSPCCFRNWEIQHVAVLSSRGEIRCCVNRLGDCCSIFDCKVLLRLILMYIFNTLSKEGKSHTGFWWDWLFSRKLHRVSFNLNLFSIFSLWFYTIYFWINNLILCTNMAEHFLDSHKALLPARLRVSSYSSTFLLHSALYRTL